MEIEGLTSDSESGYLYFCLGIVYMIFCLRIFMRLLKIRFTTVPNLRSWGHPRACQNLCSVPNLLICDAQVLMLSQLYRYVLLVLKLMTTAMMPQLLRYKFMTGKDRNVQFVHTLHFTIAHTVVNLFALV